MIKINLATRKRPTGVTEVKDITKGFTALRKIQVDPSIFRERSVRILLWTTVLGVAATFALDGIKDDQLKELDLILSKQKSEQEMLKTELNKVKGFEQLQTALDRDKQTIITKLETVQRLIADRQTPPKLLLSISSGIPAEVWLTDFNISNDEVKLTGSSLGFAQVSDFMKSLSDNAYLTDLKLLSTSRTKDTSSGMDTANFALQAKRRQNL